MVGTGRPIGDAVVRWASLARRLCLCYVALGADAIVEGARMAVAALTPRVRTIVICDDVLASETEAGVFTLEGVRQHLVAESFPWRAALSVFLLLSCPRKGKHPGKILVINEQTDKLIRYVK